MGDRPALRHHVADGLEETEDDTSEGLDGDEGDGDDQRDHGGVLDEYGPSLVLTVRHRESFIGPESPKS